MKKFGIAIVTRDRPEFLKLALDSVFSQTVPADEIFIYDSGKKPFLGSVTTPAQVRQHKADNALSMSENLNAAAKLLKSDYISILCDDDLLVPTFVETTKTTLNKSNFEALITRTEYIDEIGNFIRKARLPKPGKITAEELAISRFYWNTEFCVSGLVFNRAVFDKVGGFPDTLNGMGCDELLLTKFAQRGSLVISDFPGALAREWSGAGSTGVYSVEKRLAEIASIDNELNKINQSYVRWLKRRNRLWEYEMLLEQVANSPNFKNFRLMSISLLNCLKAGIGPRIIAGLTSRKLSA